MDLALSTCDARTRAQNILQQITDSKTSENLEAVDPLILCYVHQVHLDILHGIRDKVPDDFICEMQGILLAVINLYRNAILDYKTYDLFVQSFKKRACLETREKYATLGDIYERLGLFENWMDNDHPTLFSSFAFSILSYLDLKSSGTQFIVFVLLHIHIYILN